MNEQDAKLIKEFIKVSKNANVIVAHPDAVNILMKKGIIKKRYISYEEYVDKLYADRKRGSLNLLSKLPKLDESIANATLSDIYEEIRSSYAFGIYTSAIINSILLLEFALRYYLYENMLKIDKNYKWSNLEKLTMRQLLLKIKKLKSVPNENMKELESFCRNIRNPYLHANIEKLISNIYYAGDLLGVNITNNKTTKLTNEFAKNHNFMWFSAKRYYDKSMSLKITAFCVNNTNSLLA